MGFTDFFAKALPVVGGIVGSAFGPAGAAIGAGLGASAAGAIEGAEAAEAQKDAAKAQRRAEQYKRRLQARDLTRSVQLALATSLTGFEGSGASLESSGAQAVRSSLQSQYLNNLRNLGIQGGYADEYWNKSREAMAHSRDSGLYTSAGSILMAVGGVMPVSWPGGGTTTTTTTPPVKTTPAPAPKPGAVIYPTT